MPDSLPQDGDSSTRQTSADESSLVPGYSGLTEVGRGGFGIVYRALQLEFNRTVALKILTGVFDDAARGRFERERAAVGSLSGHPNVVTVYAAGLTTDGRPYIAMEYLPGSSLAERIRHEPMPWIDAVSAGIKIAGALQRAHDLGVLHRDVKPDNILVSEYGEPKLADFGIARLSGGYETRSGVITATVAHAAPELLEGRRPTPASDVYSLASTIYSLIAGHPPFMTGDDESLASVVARIATQPPPDLRDRDLPDEAFHALERAMRKDPEERTPTAAAFGEELQTALREDGERVPAMVVAPSDADGDREPGRGLVPGEAPRHDRRRRSVLVAAALASLLVIAGLAYALTQGGGGTRRSQPTKTAPGGIPPMPAKLPGYAHAGTATTTTFRVFSGQPAYVDNFPWTMNGCNDAMNTVRWRSLVPSDVVKGGSTDQHASTTLRPSDLKDATSGRGGVIVMDSCQEPAFFLTHSAVGDTLVDIAVTVQHWTATP